MQDMTRTTPAFLRSGAAGALALSLVLISAGQGVAQQLPQQGPPPEVEAMVAEFQEKQQRFGQLQNQAFQGSADLQARQAAISEMVVDRLFESHPEAESQIERLGELEMEAFAAQQEQDTDRLNALMQEVMSLQSQLQAAQDQVLEEEPVKTQIESFEADMMLAMLAIDPEAQELLDRLDELSEILSSQAPPQL